MDGVTDRSSRPGYYGATNQEGACPHTAHEDLLRRRLKYFFLNPCQKWRAKKKFPWKLVLQIFKIVFVTVQLGMFGLSRSSHVDFLEKSIIAFKHLYLMDWTSGLETMPYPPAAGAFAVYTIPQFYKSINYAMERYDLTEKIAMGTLQFHISKNQTKHPPMVMCNTHFLLGKNWAHNQSYQFDAREIKTCFDIPGVWEHNGTTYEYDIEKYLKYHNHTINFDGVNIIKLKFHFSAIHLKYLSRLNTPDCYIFSVEIMYDNTEHNGQMVMSLNAREQHLHCYGDIHYDGGNASIVKFYTAFDCIVILISLLSLILCMRSLVRGQKLKMDTIRFFKARYDKDLTWHEKFEFLNMWYVLIIINDLLTIIGSGFKLTIENKYSINYEACGILLGTGSLLVWFGVLRYLGFFDKYNILILTMKKSAPNILRFLVCAGVFYFGFTICGWVVLGPYHIKFKTISSSSECLFALVNGDELFVTFSVIDPHSSQAVWLFSRIYVYMFTSLFIYMVLNIFLAVIMDAYDTLKFRSLSSASECLFSLVNGDDMYVTFAAIKSNSYVWWYSRIYLYIFISLFIYVILSVFISVIMGTYETIKNFYNHGFPKTDLEQFIEECTDDAHTLFRSYSTDRFERFRGVMPTTCPLCICACLPLPCCRDRDVLNDPSEADDLVSS